MTRANSSSRKSYKAMIAIIFSLVLWKYSDLSPWLVSAFLIGFLMLETAIYLVRELRKDLTVVEEE
jgi:hypothetical protein